MHCILGNLSKHFIKQLEYVLNILPNKWKISGTKFRNRKNIFHLHLFSSIVLNITDIVDNTTLERVKEV